MSVFTNYVSHAPKNPWTKETRDQLKGAVCSVLNEYFDGIEPEASSVVTPSDLESNFGLTGGHIFHGEQTIDQMICRPTPETSHYRTPIKNLHLSGNSCHPAGRNSGDQCLLGV